MQLSWGEGFGVIALTIAVGFVWGMSFGASLMNTRNEKKNGEQITEQQYRNQSLQYLEDIRNSTTQ